MELLENLIALRIKQQQHAFHLVDQSPWPSLLSISLFHLVLFSASLISDYLPLAELLHLNPITSIFFPMTICYFGVYFIIFVMTLYFWFCNISIEAAYRGQHSVEVQNMLRNGFLLFIVSEVMFFFSFFWSFFHLSVSPSIFIGGVWPAKLVQEITIDPMGLPFYNTLILLCSGVVITWVHLQFIDNSSSTPNYSILNQEWDFTFAEQKIFFVTLPDMKFTYKQLAGSIALYITISLGALFTSLQFYEYVNCVFNISDSVYGSLFYLTTGFHGVHVIVGTLLLGVSLIRLLNNELTPGHHIGLECAIYYWHFVDIVWLFLYFFLYWWSQ